ncbi:MAG: MFS transporter [Gammaproteobacteria bacterium]
MHRVVAPVTDRIAARHAGWGFISIYAAAYAGTWLALLTPIMVTLALRARQLAPESSEYWLSLVLATGALCALVANPFFGWLSDRTTSAWGMRRPWLVGGALGGAVSLWLVAAAPSMPWMLAGWCLAQLSFNAVLAPLAALLPDHVPAARRGTVAGILSITTPLGQVGGTYLTRALSGDMAAMFLVPAAVCIVLVLALASVLPDRRLSREHVPEATGFAFMKTFWIRPREVPDFAWVCAGRFCLILCMSFLTAYQPFFLMNRLGFAAEHVPDIVFRSTLVQAAAVVLAGLVAGRLSDLTHRRKPFVIAAGLACAAGSWLIAIAPSYPVFLAGICLFGAGLGGYLSVDFALVTDVLPNKEDDAAKDLGLFNIASALPQSIAPAIASAILLSMGSYRAVFVVAGIAGVAAALAVIPVRSAR